MTTVVRPPTPTPTPVSKGDGITLVALPGGRRWVKFAFAGGIFGLLALGAGAVFAITSNSSETSVVAAGPTTSAAPTRAVAPPPPAPPSSAVPVRNAPAPAGTSVNGRGEHSTPATRAASGTTAGRRPIEGRAARRRTDHRASTSPGTTSPATACHPSATTAAATSGHRRRVRAHDRAIRAPGLDLHARGRSRPRGHSV